MASLTREELQDRLLRCIEDAIALIQGDVANPIPRFYRFELQGFGRAGMESWLDDVLNYLYRDSAFPVVVDVAVSGVAEGATFVWIRPSGHPFVTEINGTFFQPLETAPFKPVAFVWDAPRPLSLRDLEAHVPAWARENEEQTKTLRETVEEISDDLDTLWNSPLRQFWIIFDRTEERYDRIPLLPLPSDLDKIGIDDAFSCGVTAYDVEDALDIVHESIFKPRHNPSVLAIIRDVDLTLLSKRVWHELRQVRVRGVWHPPS